MFTKKTSGVQSSGSTARIDWDDLFVEHAADGGTTGTTYVRSPDCHSEVLVDATQAAAHSEGCRYE
jgi:hypothetical protein